MLSAANWDGVLDSNEVNSVYDAFWSTYNELFLLNFPLKKCDLIKTFTILSQS